HGVVYSSDVCFLNTAQFAVQINAALHPLLQPLPEILTAIMAYDLPPSADLPWTTIVVSRPAPPDHQRPLGVPPSIHARFEVPHEVPRRNIAVPLLDQVTGHQRLILWHGITIIPRNHRRNDFTAYRLTHHRQALPLLVNKCCLKNVGRPEVTESAHGDQCEQTHHHHHGECYRTAVQPDPGSTALIPAGETV